MIDTPRLGALLQRIRDEAAALRRLASREDLLDDDTALPAAKYRLVVAIEAMIDVAEHVIASEAAYCHQLRRQLPVAEGE